MQYRLICMAFNGDHITDYEGNMEECQDASSNNGSKWYFYPFHFIVNSRNMVKDTGEGLVRMSDKKSYMAAMFLNRKLNTVTKMFENLSKYCVKNNIECGYCEFEEMLINEHSDMLRFNLT